MKSYYEVLIIGAGPSGLSAGLKLQESGVDCCIIERAIYPRFKLCGGLLTQKTIDLISELNIGRFNSDLIKFKTNKVNIDNKDKRVLSFENGIPFILVDRVEFDNYLFEKYKQKGGKIVEGVFPIKFDSSSQSVFLSNGEQISYGILVGADGVKGFTSNFVGNNDLPMAFGVEVSIPTNSLVQGLQAIILDIGYLPNGYVWIFPKGVNTTIGLACSYRKNIDYVGLLKKYISDRTYVGIEYEVKGAFLPYGEHRSKIIQKDSKLFLVGDAAGLTDCITGEGLYFAIKSGILVANAIIDNNLKNIDSICKEYKKECGELISLINRSNKIMNLFYRTKPLALEILRKQPNLASFICDHQVSQYDYNFEIFKLLWEYFRDLRE